MIGIPLRLLLISALCAPISSLSVYLEPHKATCVYEDLNTELLESNVDSREVSTTVRTAFYVNKMNSHNRRMRTVVDVIVKTPYDEVILNEKDVNEESFELTARGAGKYSMCFYTRGEATKKNQPISVSETQYVARVDIYYFVPIHLWDNPEEIQIPLGHENRRSTLILNEESVSSAQRLVADMKRRTTMMIQEQKYLTNREQRHRRTVNSTNTRAVNWALAEFFVFLALAILQVVLLRRYFEVKPAVKRAIPTL